MFRRSFVLPMAAPVIFSMLFWACGCTPPDEPSPTGEAPALERADESKESLPAGEGGVPAPEPEPGEEAPAEKVEEVEKAPPPKAGPEVHVREGAERIDLEREMICTFPANIYGFASYGVDEMKIRLTLTGGTIKALGSRGLTLEPLKSLFEAAGIGGLSRRLGYGAYHSVDFHKSFNLTTESCDPEVAKVPLALKKALSLTKEKLGLDFTPRYFLAMYLWAYGSGVKPGTAKCRFIGAVYDMQEDRLHSCTIRKLVFEKGDPESLATIVRMPREICEALFGND